MAATPPAFYGSFRYNLYQYQIGIPLNAAFRFVHEPIHMSIRHRFVGRVAETEELVQRLQFSDGGSFLITGYWGVGKTSFVNQVIATLEQYRPLLRFRRSGYADLFGNGLDRRRGPAGRDRQARTPGREHRRGCASAHRRRHSVYRAHTALTQEFLKLVRADFGPRPRPGQSPR